MMKMCREFWNLQERLTMTGPSFVINYEKSELSLSSQYNEIQIPSQGQDEKHRRERPEEGK